MGGISTCEVPSSQAVGSPQRSGRVEKAPPRAPWCTPHLLPLVRQGRGGCQHHRGAAAADDHCPTVSVVLISSDTDEEEAQKRAPHVRPRHLSSGPRRSRGGGACISGPETVVGAPAPLLVVQSDDPSLSWPLNSGLAVPWSPKVISTECQTDLVFLGGSVGKESACNAGRRRGSIPGSGRSPGEGID